MHAKFLIQGTYNTTVEIIYKMKNLISVQRFKLPIIMQKNLKDPTRGIYSTHQLNSKFHYYFNINTCKVRWSLSLNASQVIVFLSSKVEKTIIIRF